MTGYTISQASLPHCSAIWRNQRTRRHRRYGVKSSEPCKNARRRTLESNAVAVILAFALASAALFTTACAPGQQGEEQSATSGIEDEPGCKAAESAYEGVLEEYRTASKSASKSYDEESCSNLLTAVIGRRPVDTSIKWELLD